MAFLVATSDQMVRQPPRRPMSRSSDEGEGRLADFGEAGRLDAEAAAKGLVASKLGLAERPAA